MWRIETEGAGETRAAAQALGAFAAPGHVLALNGELGAGKTEFVRGFAGALGVPEPEVRSPTFTLINRYAGRALELVHVDVYRLGGAAALIDLGYEEVFDPEAVVVIEWASKVQEALPSEHLWVEIEHLEGDRRRLTVRAAAPRHEALARRWQEALAAWGKEIRRCV